MKVIVYTVLSALAVSIFFLPSFYIQRTIENTTIEVVSKERLMNMSSGENGTSTSYENFVYTDDETYVVADSFWNWHFRAGTVYPKVIEGSTCDVTLSGIRMGFLSMYQNIIDVKCK